MFRELVNAMREWFDSVHKDQCNGQNNLYIPQLTCLNNHTGIISSEIRYEGECTPQMLIDLAIADVQERQPPAVHLSHGWILRLNLTSSEEMQNSSSSDKPQSMIIGISIGLIIAAIIILFSVVGIIFGIHKR